MTPAPRRRRRPARHAMNGMRSWPWLFREHADLLRSSSGSRLVASCIRSVLRPAARRLCGLPWVLSSVSLGISLGRGPRETPRRTRWQMLSSGSSGDPAVLGQRRPELPARGDTELGEHVAQVPLDRARTDEQLRADLRVRQAVAGQPGDLLLLRRELVARVGASLADLLARREQLAAGALGERLHPDRGEQVVGRT